MKMKSKLLTLSMFVVATNAAAISADNKILKNCKFSPKHALSKVMDKGSHFALHNYNDTDNQNFTLTYQETSLFGRVWFISGQHSGKCIHTDDDVKGALLKQYDCPDWATWILDSQQSNDGYYFIRSPYNINFVLDVKGNNTGNGSKIHEWTYHGGNNQKWRIWGCQDMDGHGVSPAT
jgi:hypothetical protein